jgi:hypothetical protein
MYRPLLKLLWIKHPLMSYLRSNQLPRDHLRIQVNKLKKKLHKGIGPMEDVSDQERISIAGTFLTG